MPAAYPIQTNFIGGEITPRLRGLVTTEQYRRSLARCENFHPTPQGSLRRRSGSFVVGEALSTTSRLFSFPVIGEQDFIFEINDTSGRIWSQSALINETAAQRLRDPTFLAGFREWSLSAGTTDEEISLIPGVGFSVNVGINNTASIIQVLDPAEVGVFHTIQFTVRMDAPNDLENRGIAILVRRRLQGGTAFFDETFVRTGSAAPDQGETVDVSLSASLISTGPTEIIIRFEDIPDSEEVAQQLTISNLRIVDTISPSVPYSFTSPYTADQLNNIQTAFDSASRIVVFTHPEVAPHRLRLEELDGHRIFSFEPIGFINTPTEWIAANYPGACEFFQGRLVLGGTPNQGGTIWGSRVGSIFDFNLITGDEPTPDDGYQFTLVTNGGVQWIRGTKVLIIGTEVSTWTGTGTGGLLSNNNFDFEKQSELGNSRRVSPLLITDQVVSIANDFTAIRVTNFDGINTNTYASEEISLQSENFFRFGGIDEIAYIRQPFYQLFVISNQQMRVCMHDRITGLNAWSRWVTNGAIRSIVASRTGGNDGEDLWMVVTRGTLTLIERHTPELGNEQDTLDGGITATIQVMTAAQNMGEYSNAYSDAFARGQSERAFIDGLDLYNGLTLQCTINILTGGFLQSITHPDVTISGGVAFLSDDVIQYVGRTATVGYGFSCEAITLPIDEGNRAGTAQGTLRHFNRIFARLISNSAIPTLNARRPRVRGSTRVTDNLDDQRFNGDVEVRDMGTRKQGVITVAQDINLPTEINSLFGKINTQVI